MAEKERIEPGVTVSLPNLRRGKGGATSTVGLPMTTFKLSEMSDEAIERYGLTKYVQQQGGDNDDKQRS